MRRRGAALGAGAYGCVNSFRNGTAEQPQALWLDGGYAYPACHSWLGSGYSAHRTAPS